MQNALSHYGKGMKTLGVAIARAHGKNHSAEKFKELQRGMVSFTQVTDEATRPNIDIKIPKRKEFKPKRKRIKDREPYYVKLTSPRKDNRKK